MQEPQVREQVDDLLLAEVAAPGRAIRRQTLAPESLLVLLRIRARGEQHDDLAGFRLAGVDELAHTSCDPPGFARAPVLLRIGEARLVGDEQLDGMPEHGIRELRGCRKRLVVVAERIAEEVVHCLEHLRSRAVVAREREQRGRLRAALAEDLEIRVAEPVDRLELVSDREDLRRIGVCNEVDELALQPIRVLELVHHDHPEAQLRRLAHGRVVAEQVARGELQVLEVHDGLATLRRRVLGSEPLEQLLQEIAIRCGQLLERRLLHALACGLERGRAPASRRERREVDEPLREGPVRDDAECLVGVAALRLGRGRIGRQRIRLDAQRRDRTGDVGPLTELELEVPSGGAERLVHAREHATKACRAIGREEPEPLRFAVGAERLESALERLARAARPHPRPRARGSEDRGRPRTDGRAAAWRRSRESWRSRRRRARARDPAARARAAPPGCACGAPRPPCACT